jgi:transcriptional regulator with XRE-family HTH domain
MLEAGKRKSPSVPVLQRLAKALRVSVGELVE